MRVVTLELILTLISLWPFSDAKSWRVRRSTSLDADILCNADTKFECVCHFGDGDLLRDHKSCYALIVSHTLPALRLVLSHFANLDPIVSESLVSNRDGVEMTYENFFKLSLANLTTTYCQRDSSRCPNVGLSVRPRSVVVLHLESLDSNRLLVDYCIVRSIDVEELRPSTIVDADVVLRASKFELQKLLPYPIVEHREHTIVVQSSSAWKENLGLISALIIFACILVFIYIIAIIKAVRDRSKSQRSTTSQSRKESNPAAAAKSTQYGSTDHRSQPLRLESEPGEKRSSTLQEKPNIDELIKASENEINIRNGPYGEKSPPSVCPRPLPPPSRKVISSRSLQFDDSKNEKLIKKAATCYQFATDNVADRDGSIVISDVLGEIASPKSEDVYARENDSLGDKKEESDNDKEEEAVFRAINIPILIVPAMSTHRNDDDYSSKNDYDDDEDLEATKSPLKKDSFGKRLTRAMSEEYLLSNENRRGSTFEKGSTGSSDTTNSDDDDDGDRSPQPPLFDVDYQPLRDSNWSVNRTSTNETETTNVNLNLGR